MYEIILWIHGGAGYPWNVPCCGCNLVTLFRIYYYKYKSWITRAYLKKHADEVDSTTLQTELLDSHVSKSFCWAQHPQDVDKSDLHHAAQVLAGIRFGERHEARNHGNAHVLSQGAYFKWYRGTEVDEFVHGKATLPVTGTCYFTLWCHYFWYLCICKEDGRHDIKTYSSVRICHASTLMFSTCYCKPCSLEKSRCRGLWRQFFSFSCQVRYVKIL